jgi:predicted secreted protein
MSKYFGGDVLLKLALDGSTNLTTIAQVRDISGPGISRDAPESTARDSTNKWREFIKGFKDGGEVTFDIVFDPDLGTHDDATGILADLNDDDTIASWQLTWPDDTPTTWTFNGIVTGFEPTAPYKDTLTASVTIKVSGEPVIA